MEFVTIEEARSHIRIDTSADDPWLMTWIPAIEAAVRSWLKDDWRLYVPSEFEDSNGDPIPAEDSSGPIVQPMVKAAVLIELAVQYRYRDGTEYEQTATGDLYSGRYGYILSRGATALLHSLRKATLI